MPLPKLDLIVPEESYGFSDGETVLRAKLSGGPSRHRLDMIGAPVELQMTLVLEGETYQYWRAFYRSTIREGSLPFLIDLIIDNAEMTEYQAKIIPGSTGLGSKSGDAYMVPLRLEVKMPPRDAAFDDALVMLYSFYGDGSDELLNRLAVLVNSDLPDAFG